MSRDLEVWQQQRARRALLRRVDADLILAIVQRVERPAVREAGSSTCTTCGTGCSSPVTLLVSTTRSKSSTFVEGSKMGRVFGASLVVGAENGSSARSTEAGVCKGAVAAFEAISGSAVAMSALSPMVLPFRKVAMTLTSPTESSFRTSITPLRINPI